jgi:hypothetical protein
LAGRDITIGGPGPSGEVANTMIRQVLQVVSRLVVSLAYEGGR